MGIRHGYSEISLSAFVSWRECGARGSSKRLVGPAEIIVKPILALCQVEGGDARDSGVV